MIYSYETEKAWLFTDEGSRAFVRTRDAFLAAIRKTGAAHAGIIFECGAAVAPDSWKGIAMLDRMVELGDVRYVVTGNRAWQDQIIEVARGR